MKKTTLACGILSLVLAGCTPEPAKMTTPEGARTYPPTGREAPKNAENHTPTGKPSTTTGPTPTPVQGESKSPDNVSNAPGTGGMK